MWLSPSYRIILFESCGLKGAHHIFLIFDEAPRRTNLSNWVQLAFFLAKTCETSSGVIPFFFAQLMKPFQLEVVGLQVGGIELLWGYCMVWAWGFRDFDGLESQHRDAGPQHGVVKNSWWPSGWIKTTPSTISGLLQFLHIIKIGWYPRHFFTCWCSQSTSNQTPLRKKKCS